MANMVREKTPMPVQDPLVRARNFEEVATGYTSEQAKGEAQRCLQCKNRPCVEGCPVGVAIPEFIKAICEDDTANAAAIIRQTNTLPAVCGRVCPQENQCEKLCVRGRKGEPVGIGRLERFAADYALENPQNAGVPEWENNRKVAVIGSGPAGLSCAGELRGKGYDVTIYEAFHKAGGVLVYGIPEFRLPKEIVRREVQSLLEAGVKLVTNCVVGRSMTIEDLFADGFQAVFIGSGAGLPRFMSIPGENLNGVYSANEFLTRINLMRAYDKRADTPLNENKHVVVVGGGNVAMDAARCALRMGADTVDIVYRRSMEEMPARAEEVHHAMEEGIKFRILTNPREILGNEVAQVCGMVCDVMTLGEPDESGRQRPVLTGETVTVECDCVVMAIGSSPNPLLRMTTPDLKFNRWGCVDADEATGQTNVAGIYAGGDAVTGAATVILAMGAGRAAAQEIDAYVSSL